MKPSIKFGLIAIIVSVCLFANTISANLTKNDKKAEAEKEQKQVHIVKDQNGFQSSLNHVVRRSPTVTTVTKMGANRLETPSNVIHASNSNTSNGPNVGFLGKSAELVEPHIVMHSKSPISVVTETPAHIGWRNEQNTLTTLNSSTGKVEQHTTTNKVPIYGKVQEVKTVYKDDIRSLDLDTKRMGLISSSISQE